MKICIIFFFVENIFFYATFAVWGMAWLELPMRVVVSCDKLGRGAYIFGTQDCLMGLPSTFVLFRVGLGTHRIETS